LLKLTTWTQARSHLNDGWWEGLQFDRAVMWFGRHVEGKLLERDDRGNALYTLEGLLSEGGDEDAQHANFDAFAALLGGV
jgi:hypothetical protein